MSMYNELALSIDEIFNLVSINGHLKSYIVEGPMGSGKSSMIDMARERFGENYNYAVVDCTQLDVGDVQIPDIDKVNNVVRFLPNVLLMGVNNKPMFILLDELGKASRSVQNALLPVMLERRVGASKMPVGSVVFAATNLSSENVGDLFQPHLRNRVSFIQMRSPTNEEWIQWAMSHNVAPEMLAWAHENPQLFHSFQQYENPDDNEYIFHPKKQRKAFVSPRSLYLASLELRPEARVVPIHVTRAALAGNIGPKAAMDLMAFVELADKMPSWDSIVASPETATVPTSSPAAMCLTVFSAVAKCNKGSLLPTIVYMKRLPTEIQCMFATQLMQGSKGSMAALFKPFTDWLRENHWAII